MKPEDKAVIAEYMGWEYNGDYNWFFVRSDIKSKIIYFDSNDTSLCVQKMVEKGDINLFLQYSYQASYETETGFVPWLFNPDNFFSAMASWLRGEGK